MKQTLYPHCLPILDVQISLHKQGSRTKLQAETGLYITSTGTFILIIFFFFEFMHNFQYNYTLYDFNATIYMNFVLCNYNIEMYRNVMAFEM